MDHKNPLIQSVEEFVTQHIRQNVSTDYAYHDLEHTLNVVDAAHQIGEASGLSDDDMETLQLAAWFHDTGYDEGPVGHEERSVKYAKKGLAAAGLTPEKMELIEGCIMATKLPQEPKNLLERNICDADLGHLGQRSYWDRCGKLRHEFAIANNHHMTEQEWMDFEMKFIINHEYHTQVAKDLFGKRKDKHIRQLNKQRSRLYSHNGVEDKFEEPKKKKKKSKRKPTALSNTDLQLKEINLGRGVETMYRTTYRTHVNLSSIADNKANIMLSINAIIISITLSTLVPKLADNPKLIIPTGMLLSVCMLSIIFATLATRPKITEGKFSREDIEKKRSNLLFFGNFYNMKLEDFHWGMMEMIKDSDFLYSSMTRDLYFLGVVLAKKYRYLSVCYGIFMYGLIATVIGFVIAFGIL